jgi:beta-glucanase (GH16 family)
LSDLRHLQPTDELPVPPPPRRGPSRTVILIAGLVALALVATLVFVLVRPGGGGGTGGTAGAPETTAPPKPSAGEDTSAGKMLNWGTPSFAEEFTSPDALTTDKWDVYNGAGHVGNGKRSPDQMSIKDGVLTITGDSDGTTGGMGLDDGQKYGRWEGRVRAPVSDDTYHAVMLLWPDDEKWPESGEVDFMEMLDPNRQETNVYVHYGKDNDQEHGEVKADATQWHNWAVEWTPEHIITYLDGREWFRVTDPKALPPGPMHLAIQLDWFPDDDNKDADVKQSSMDIDWVKQYPYPGK